MNRHVGGCGGDLELLEDDPGLLVLAQANQAFVVAVQAPDVAWMLTGPGQSVVEAKVGTVDGLGLGQHVLLEEQGTVGVPGGLHPTPRLVVGQTVVQFDRTAQVREGRVVVPSPVFQFAVQHRLGDLEDVLARVVEHGARGRYAPGGGGERAALLLRLP